MPKPDPLQYDSFAGEYEACAATASYNAGYDRPAVLELLGDVAGKRVLDAGCGPGFYTAALLQRGADVVGCDASPAMVELAEKRVGDRADLRVHDLEQPFEWLEDGSFDLVISALVLHYLTDRLGFLKKMHRVLRPDGALTISTHHPTEDWQRLGGSYFSVEPVTETWSQGWEITAWRMPLTQICYEISQSGFLIERLVEPMPEPSLAKSDPIRFERLSTQPAFILFRLVKGC
ncbi:MAG: methyltransferase domain-containing protein [Acidobacteria bacterium]|nr:methyltransferase domain-containing protein [Acidobacteriota bacterium]